MVNLTTYLSVRDTLTGQCNHIVVESLVQYYFCNSCCERKLFYRCEMTNHLCAQPSDNNYGNQAVEIELPNGSTGKIFVGNKNATVRDLKVGCELQFGIPSNLQKASVLENPNTELNDWLLLKDTIQTIDDVIVVQVPVWWNKFICVSLNNEIENVCRRAKLPMQQISKEERLFVGLFIACCHGHEKLLERLKTLDIQLDQHAGTESGRNLFHAAAASGNVNCVEFVAKHLIKPSKETLTKLDTNRETPIDIARRLNHQDMERLLFKYMYHEKGEREERCSAESGIDISEDCDSIESDDSSEERKPQNENTNPEETQRDCESSTSKMKNLSLEEGELVITECDEGLSFAVDLKTAQQDPPPKPRKSEVGVIQQDRFSDNSHNLNQTRAASPCSSDGSDESPSLSPRFNRPNTLNLSPNQHLLRRRFVKVDPGRPKSARTVRCPQINVHQKEDEEVGAKDNYLPPLESQNLVGQNGGSSAPSIQLRRLKQAVVRMDSTPNSPAPKQRLSPSPDEDLPVTKSAPGSPQNPRRLVFKPSVKPPAPGNIVSPLSPNISRVLDRRRGSEPLASLNRTNGIRLGRSRRDAVLPADLPYGDSFAPTQGSPLIYKRGKARSICEVSLMDSLRGHKDIDDEERLDRPWNAWIAVRKESIQLTSHENASQSPNSSRRMSYQQWLSEKDLAHLRKIFANAQEDAKTNEKQAKLLKGKTFDEWLEDKRREMEREKEKEKGIEENQKQEEDKKHYRRKMSQAKYEKWLMQKEKDALKLEEKMEQEAKQKHEIMRKKWEEEDEQKKNCKLPLGKTHSLPVEGIPRAATINKHRFASLK